MSNDTTLNQDSSTEVATPMFVNPYEYELNGGGIKISYIPMGAGAVPHFIYEDAKYGKLTFMGKGKINQIDVPGLGTLISVNLGKIEPGSTSPIFTILLPQVNLLDKKGASALVHTIGITTIHKSSGLPPQFYLGQTETYTKVSMIGTASIPSGAVPY